MSKEYKAYYRSEIGLIKIMGTEKGVSFVGFVKEEPTENPEVHPSLKKCVVQLNEYFQGTRKKFTIKLQPQGTDFQKQVWNQLMKIPFGETASYKNVAEAIGKEKAVRAVGNANGSNNISIIIPCHRVIGNNGKLVGYGGGLDRKQWLLDHEARYYNK
ncbi:methylated-DNA--[protein]-cysteine S-methyltransferase [[Eubacterium] cellulosolvens]